MLAMDEAIRIRDGMTTHLLRKTGIEVLGYMPWSTHCCHFFQTQKDLLETLIPFFRAGLEARESCFWAVDDPLTELSARQAVKEGIPEGERYLMDGSIEIVSGHKWYCANGGEFSMARVLRGWDEKCTQTLARGYTGMRASGNVSSFRANDSESFDEYEKALGESLSQRPMIVLCGYALDKSRAADVLDVARTHQYVIAKRVGDWEVVEWRPPPDPSDPYATLTRREQMVLLLAAEGSSNPEIAKALSISVRTVESHRANLMRKLGLRHQTDLVRYALRRGLLAIPTQQQ